MIRSPDEIGYIVVVVVTVAVAVVEEEHDPAAELIGIEAGAVADEEE